MNGICGLITSMISILPQELNQWSRLFSGWYIFRFSCVLSIKKFSAVSNLKTMHCITRFVVTYTNEYFTIHIRNFEMYFAI